MKFKDYLSESSARSSGASGWDAEVKLATRTARKAGWDLTKIAKEYRSELKKEGISQNEIDNIVDDGMADLGELTVQVFSVDHGMSASAVLLVFNSEEKTVHAQEFNYS